MTRHVVFQAPDSFRMDELKIFLERMGCTIKADYTLLVAEESPTVGINSGWLTIKDDVPVYMAVGGPMIGVLPKGVRVREYKAHIVTDGNLYYIEHDGAGIPGLSGWSLTNGNFQRPKLDEPKPAPVTPLPAPVAWPKTPFKVRVKIAEVNIYETPDLTGKVKTKRSRDAIMDVHEVMPSGSLRVYNNKPFLYAPGDPVLYVVLKQG